MSTARTIKIICHWGHEAGFRLGGAQTVAVADSEELNEMLETIISEKEVGILAIPTDMERWISPKNVRAMERASMPILARYCWPEQWTVASEAREYAEKLARNAIGFHFTIRV